MVLYNGYNSEPDTGRNILRIHVQSVQSEREPSQNTQSSTFLPHYYHSKPPGNPVQQHPDTIHTDTFNLQLHHHNIIRIRLLLPNQRIPKEPERSTVS